MLQTIRERLLFEKYIPTVGTKSRGKKLIGVKLASTEILNCSICRKHLRMDAFVLQFRLDSSPALPPEQIKVNFSFFELASSSRLTKDEFYLPATP